MYKKWCSPNSKQAHQKGVFPHEKTGAYSVRPKIGMHQSETLFSEWILYYYIVSTLKSQYFFRVGVDIV